MFLKRSAAGFSLLFIFFFCSSYLTGDPAFTPDENIGVGERSFRPLNLAKKDAGLESYFQRLQRYAGFSGVVLLAEKGEVIHSGAYGMANYRGKDTLTINTPFQLASVSKSLTALLIMRLYEEGLLDFDEPVQTYVPDFPYAGITIRHLLNQRSGLCRYMYLADKYWDQDRPLTNEDVLCLFQTYKPDTYFTPGKRFNYINTNYVMLALVAERLTNKPFSELMEEEVFKPLGMNQSVAFSLAEAAGVEGAATGHRRYRKWGFRPVPFDYLDGAVGDKGIYASARDLLLLDQALYGNRFLKQETISEALQPGSPELRTHNYGFGWRMKTKVEGLVYHFGWWRGFRTCFIRDLAQQKTLIVLCNSDHSRGLLGYWGLVRLLRGDPGDGDTDTSDEDLEADELASVEQDTLKNQVLP